MMSVVNGHHTPPSNGLMQQNGYNSLQTLSMPMTITQPQSMKGDQSLSGGDMHQQAMNGTSTNGNVMY
jgi:hypothetical protein